MWNALRLPALLCQAHSPELPEEGNVVSPFLEKSRVLLSAWLPQRVPGSLPSSSQTRSHAGAHWHGPSTERLHVGLVLSDPADLSLCSVNTDIVPWDEELPKNPIHSWDKSWA